MSDPVGGVRIGHERHWVMTFHCLPYILEAHWSIHGQKHGVSNQCRSRERFKLVPFEILVLYDVGMADSLQWIKVQQFGQEVDDWFDATPWRKQSSDRGLVLEMFLEKLQLVWHVLAYQ